MSTVDRRTAERFPIPFGMRCRLLKEKSSPQAANCTDLGCGGIGLVVDTELKVYGTIKGKLYFEDESEPLSCTCRVAWCNRLSEGQYQVGLEFIDVEDHIRLMKLLKKNIQET